MSYPYLSDVIQAATGYALPLPLAFGLFVALGALAAGASFRAELKRFYEAGRIGPAYVNGLSRPPQEIVSDFIIIVLIAGVLGARLFHILDHLDQFFADPLGMLLTRSGLSIFGGLIFGTFAGMLCARRWRLPVTPLLDAAAPALMLGYGIGRIGCQISGDGDWGIAANMALKPDWLPSWLWAQTYDNNIYGELIAAPGVYPTPMYETAMALLCFALLWPCGAIHSASAGYSRCTGRCRAPADRTDPRQSRHQPRQPARHASRTDRQRPDRIRPDRPAAQTPAPLIFDYQTSINSAVASGFREHHISAKLFGMNA
jgi:phosphatidylglycerol:prolipoprotein diacylglycerol transferase